MILDLFDVEIYFGYIFIVLVVNSLFLESKQFQGCNDGMFSLIHFGFNFIHGSGYILDIMVFVDLILDETLNTKTFGLASETK